MEELIDDIVELYFLGGDLNEILREAHKLKREMYIVICYKLMFKNWGGLNG